MQANIHPEYTATKVSCSCGNQFETRSTLAGDLSLEVCAECHPFYTGKQKVVSKGRVENFMNKFTMFADDK